MKRKIIFITITVLLLAASCKIGKFMDIDNNNEPLYLYVLTTADLITYEVDTENGTLTNRRSTPLPSLNNECKLVYENEKNNLFVSNGTTVRRFSGYSISDDGSLQEHSWSPYSPAGGNPIYDFIFDDNKSFLYALIGSNIYGFRYESDGSIPNITAAETFSGPSPAHLGNYKGFLFRQDNSEANTLFNIDSGTGLLSVASNAAPPINNMTTGALIVSNDFIYKIDGSTNPSEINSYSISGGTTEQKSANIQCTNTTSNINNTLLRDPELRYLYFVSSSEDNIFAIRTNTNGTVGALLPEDTISTGVGPNAAAIDPYKQFFFTGSTDGSVEWQLNIHRMDGDRPLNSFTNTHYTEQILEMIAVRGKK